MSRFRPARAIERQEHDWGVIAQVSGPRDGLAEPEASAAAKNACETKGL